MKINEIIAYHGRASGVKGFDLKHGGQNSSTFGDYDSVRWGSFFTTNPKFAAMYGEVEKYDLRIRKTAKLSNELISSFVDYAREQEIDRELMIDISQIAQGHWSIWHLFEDEVGELFVEWITSQGYDSASFTEYNENDAGEELKSNTIVVFNPSMIEYEGQLELDLYK